MMTGFDTSVLWSSEEDFYTTADMMHESMHWLDELLKDIHGPGSAWEHNQRDGFQGNDIHHDVALDSSHS